MPACAWAMSGIWAKVGRIWSHFRHTEDGYAKEVACRSVARALLKWPASDSSDGIKQNEAAS